MEACFQVWADGDNGLPKHGYYTYQLLIHTAVVHVNIKSLLALASEEYKVQL